MSLTSRRHPPPLQVGAVLILDVRGGLDISSLRTVLQQQRIAVIGDIVASPVGLVEVACRGRRREVVVRRFPPTASPHYDRTCLRTSSDCTLKAPTAER